MSASSIVLRVAPCRLGLVAVMFTAACASTGPASSTSAPVPQLGSTPAVTATTDFSTTATPSTAGPTVARDDLDSQSGIEMAIVGAERGIRDATLSTAAITHWGRRQQRAYRALANHPEWDDAVRALLPTDVVVPFDFNVEARRAVEAHAAARPPTPPVDTLPAWTIAAPLPIAELLDDYRRAEAATGVPWQYLAAINLVETRVGRIVGASVSGAVGPMQFLPTTWASCCAGDVLNPRDAIMGAAVYLVSRGAPADMRGALYGYNPNDGYVGAVDAYARNMIADERAYNGYHAWEVYVTTSSGTVRLPVGYAATQATGAAEYLAQHPEDLAPVSD